MRDVWKDLLSTVFMASHGGKRGKGCRKTLGLESFTCPKGESCSFCNRDFQLMHAKGLPGNQLYFLTKCK